MQSRDENEHSFMTQQMNVATGGFKPIFPKEKLLAATIDEEKLPITGTVHVAWRLELGAMALVLAVAGLLAAVPTPAP